jgi:hypothetical protein
MNLLEMSLVYWERLLEDPEIPFDITFQLAAPAEGGTEAAVSAHRLVLGLSSPVLRAQLFDWPGGEPGSVIEVPDVTYCGMRALVDYIYGKPLHLDNFDQLGPRSAAGLLEIAYAAEKYCVAALTCEMVAIVGKCAVTEDQEERRQIAELAAGSRLEAVSLALLARCDPLPEVPRPDAPQVGVGYMDILVFPFPQGLSHQSQGLGPTAWARAQGLLPPPEVVAGVVGPMGVILEIQEELELVEQQELVEVHDVGVYDMNIV